MIESDFVFTEPPLVFLDKGSVTLQSPSNIALIKYWGKKDIQIPANPSLSFTLSKSFTEMTLSFERLATPTRDYDINLWFEGTLNELFKKKIILFFDKIIPYIPFLKIYRFKIETHNSFPHSSGIASSASSMSALSLALIKMEVLFGKNYSKEDVRRRASFLARLGSGSACRSLWAGLVLWGKHSALKESSDIYGVPLKKSMIHQKFITYQDTILLIDKKVKKVSSSLGHQLMNNHPYREARYVQAKTNISCILKALSCGDTDRFIEIVESEALTLHGLMMTSRPSFILMKPHTLSVIQEVWNYRRQHSSQLCFTLDAGANVHLLYPKSEKEEVQEFIKKRLVVYCENQEYLCDEVASS